MEETEGAEPKQGIKKEEGELTAAKRKTFIINGLNLRNQQPASPQYKKWLPFIFLILIIVGLVYGGVIVSRKALQSVRKSKTSPTPTQTLEPTPTAKLDKGELKIKVLNGTGKKAAAAAAVQYLQDKGYSQKIETGNADNFDYKETVVKIKETKKDYFLFLKEDLQGEYQVGTQAATLDEESEYDTLIIIGAP